MKVYYDKGGKQGDKKNFKVKNSETLKIGDYIFYSQDFIGWASGETYIWNFPLDELEQAQKMFERNYSLGEFNSDLPKLKNGGDMFRYCSALRTFNSNLSSLTDGYMMFFDCDKLSSFGSKLTSLKSGYRMFENCSLNDDSLIYIADNINDISSLDKEINEDWQYEVLGETKTIEYANRGRIDIDYNESVSQDVLSACGNKLIDKGWDVYFNGTLYEWATTYDVSEANGYIPDASNWNDHILTPNMDILKISIVNEKGEMLKDE